VARTLADTVEYERSGRPPTAQLIIEPEELTGSLEARGFTVLARGPEGTIRVDERLAAPQPFFAGSYFGQLGCYEILARKQEHGR
jgi:hypothetical protein